ncbi:MAG: sugar ABC transporter permease [Clostridia bacterium]|nr:sugar ABC transporter permease [Clostridia bacterium]MBR1685169.1 sugar ABC transporter permease [Clostridia bacterium]MBR2287758.1 sugar ABC transporter permease [Clostridia bacterium]
MIIALVVVTIIFSRWPGKEGLILLPSNLTGLIAENAYVFVLATGMLLCILTGGNIDLSVGSVVCFTAAVGCIMMASGANIWVTVLAMLAIGLAIGVFQGFWIAKLRVPAFIATLAGMYAFRGFSNVVLNGYRVDITNQTFLMLFGNGKTSFVPDVIRQQFTGLDSIFNKENTALAGIIGENFITNFNLTCMVLGALAALIFVIARIRRIRVQKKLGIIQSTWGQVVSTVIIALLVLWVAFKLSCYRGLPYVLIWIALVLGIYAYITTKTAIGRHLYAVGGNEKATALSGVKTRNVYWFAYANIGLLAGLAGILTAGRAKGIDPVYGEGYEMDAIAACFIGGASAYGGTGKVSGMIIGAILMGVINKGMIIVGVDANYQKVVKGIVLLIAVMFDVLSKRQKR